ncbi:MAG: hypothetical protein QOK05_2886 [Chloroflexota bacterium]|jgi:DNA-binding MarR family transcriptional regulator|nr:hypothetical protein [Chloroflexota bacterium]
MAADAGFEAERSVQFVLVELLAGPMRMSELARRQGTDISTVSRQVRAAEALGLVQRAPDVADGRASILSLSPAGHRMADRLRRSHRRVVAEILEDWSADEVESFSRLLARFTERFLATADGGAPAAPRQGRQAGLDRTGS